MHTPELPFDLPVIAAPSEGDVTIRLRDAIARLLEEAAEGGPECEARIHQEVAAMCAAFGVGTTRQ